METIPPPTPDFRAIFEAAPELYLIVDSELRIVAGSDAYLQATMTRRADIVGRPMFDVFPDNPDDVNATGVRNLAASFDNVLRSRVAHFMAIQKYDIRQSNGAGSHFTERYWQPANFPVIDERGRVAYIIHRVADITELVRLKHSSREAQERLEADLYLRSREIERSNQLLRESLLDKEVLLREIHHRVKNNLQVIDGLLRLQGQHVADPAARTALADMGSRIRAIAEIHQTLYSSADLARVDMAKFASHLVNNLLSLYELDGDRVRVQVEVASPSFEIGLAVPCGLILNELINNALKHAFADGRAGTIVAALGKPGELLGVADDGVGLPAPVDKAATATLGMQLVHLLAEQIGAKVRVASDRGTRVTVTSPATS